MANPEHLEILKRGVKAWNKWREKSQLLNPDLSDANLDDLELAFGDFSATNFAGASLCKSTFQEAKLDGADLNNADLSGVDFTLTNITGAEVAGANFNEAYMYGTVIGDVDLSEAKNLESVKHVAPSTIGIDTIYRSGGNIPEKFLRGCGVPEDFITYLRSLVGKPIEFYSCFISYSSRDEGFTKLLYKDLQSEGVRCWFAPEDLKIGDRFRVRIDESIRLHDKLLLVLSENSVSSEWVGDEVEAALEKEEGQEGKVVLFPLRLDGAVLEIKEGWPAKVRRTRHIGDFSDWKNHDSYKRAFERLMRDLKAGEKR
jgi:hypothetical protein